MQKRFRLSRSEDFKRVRRTGKSYAHPLVVLVAQASETKEHLKVGITAGKTTGTAVHRNRAKRLLREAMRTLIPSIASGWDLILIARRPLAGLGLGQAQDAVKELLRRARVIRRAEEREGDERPA